MVFCAAGLNKKGLGVQMKMVSVQGLTLGSGRPKICIPVTAEKQAEILAAGQQIAGCKGVCADLCEWRIDWFDKVFDSVSLRETGLALRRILDGMPLLVTFRTKQEGGKLSCDRERYRMLIEDICSGGYADLVDIELFTAGEDAKELAELAAEKGIKTIFSSHDFQHTPPRDEILFRLEKMEQLGADICKIAVMPHSAEDVLTLLNATEERSRVSGVPLITMSMGRLGAVSRVCGELVGSCLTFGTLGKASAPGQLPAAALEKILGLLRLGDEEASS